MWIRGFSLSIAVTLVHDFALDDVLAAGSRTLVAGRRATGGGRLLLRTAVGLLGELVRRLEQLVGRLLDRVRVSALQRLLRGLDLRPDVGLLVLRDLVAGLGERLLDGVDRVVRLV